MDTCKDCCERYNDVMAKNPWLKQELDTVNKRIDALHKWRWGIFIGYILYIVVHFTVSILLSDSFPHNIGLIVNIGVGVCYIIGCLIINNRLQFYRSEHIRLHYAIQRAYEKLGYTY